MPGVFSVQTRDRRNTDPPATNETATRDEHIDPALTAAGWAMAQGNHVGCEQQRRPALVGLSAGPADALGVGLVFKQPRTQLACGREVHSSTVDHPGAGLQNLGLDPGRVAGQLGQPGGLGHDEIAQLACEGALSVVKVVARQHLCRRVFHRQLGQPRGLAFQQLPVGPTSLRKVGQLKRLHRLEREGVGGRADGRNVAGVEGG